WQRRAGRYPQPNQQRGRARGPGPARLPAATATTRPPAINCSTYGVAALPPLSLPPKRRMCQASLLPLGAPAQGRDLGPELPPGFALVLGQLLQRVRVADSSQVQIVLPAGERARRARVRLASIDLSRQDGEVSPQPVEGLPAQAGALRGV